MSEEYLEEEDFQTKFTGKTFRRIIGLTKPHWKWVVGFLLAIAAVSGLDSFFTFLSKRLIDEGIVPGNKEALVSILAIYGSLLVVQALFVFFFIYLAGVLGERIRYHFKKIFIQPSTETVAFILQPHTCWLDHVQSYIRYRARGRPGYLGSVGYGLGSHEYHNVHDFHGHHQLEISHTGFHFSAYPALCITSIQKKDLVAIQKCQEIKFQDYSCL